jgi:hypothetical protein
VKEIREFVPSGRPKRVVRSTVRRQLTTSVTAMVISEVFDESGC